MTIKYDKSKGRGKNPTGIVPKGRLEILRKRIDDTKERRKAAPRASRATMRSLENYKEKRRGWLSESARPRSGPGGLPSRSGPITDNRRPGKWGVNDYKPSGDRRPIGSADIGPRGRPGSSNEEFTRWLSSAVGNADSGNSSKSTNPSQYRRAMEDALMRHAARTRK